MRLHFADHRAAAEAGLDVRHRLVRRTQRHALHAGGVEDAVAQFQRRRLAAALGADHHDRAEDAVLDTQRRARAIERDAGLARALRVAVAVQRPARHQRAVADQQLAQVVVCGGLVARPVHLDAAAHDQQAVQQHAAAGAAADAERVRLAGTHVEQAQHRPRALGGAQLDRLARIELQVDAALVHATFGQLDHQCAQRRRGRLGLHPRRQCVGDAAEMASRPVAARRVIRQGGMHHVAGGAFQFRREPRVFAAAEVGGEAVLVAHPHAALRPLVGREQQAAALGVDCHAPALDLPAPAGQIRRHQQLARHRHSLPLRRPVRRPHLHAAAVAIEFGRHAGVVGQRPALGETPAAQRQRQVALVGDVGGFGFRDRALEQRRVVAEHAEAEALRAAFLDAVRRRAAHRVAAQAAGEHADRRDVVAAAPMRAAHAPQVDAVRERIERAVRPAESLQPPRIAQVGRATAVRMLMIEVLHPAEPAVELHRARRPAGRVAGQVFQQRQRALAPARVDRVGHVGARRQHAAEAGVAAPVLAQRGRLGQQAVTEQVADIRHHPVVAGLDEPVVVQPGDVLFEHIGLAGQHAQEVAQRPALLRIAHAIDHRQQVVQPIRAHSHGMASCSSKVSGTFGGR